MPGLRFLLLSALQTWAQTRPAATQQSRGTPGSQTEHGCARGKALFALFIALDCLGPVQRCGDGWWGGLSRTPNFLLALN